MQPLFKQYIHVFMIWMIIWLHMEWRSSAIFLLVQYILLNMVKKMMIYGQ